MNEAWLLRGLPFGAIGLGFFAYGRKQKAVVPMVCGLGLMIYPYLIANTVLLVAIGLILTVAPYFIRI